MKLAKAKLEVCACAYFIQFTFILMQMLLYTNQKRWR